MTLVSERVEEQKPFGAGEAAGKPAEYDIIIIGAGQAGDPLASRFAGAGKRTACVERLHVGGTCANVGCTPTKTMIASAEVAYLAKRGADFGVMTGPVSIDMSKVRQRKRDIVEEFNSESTASLMDEQHLDLIFGHARFTGAREVEVLHIDGSFSKLTAPIIVINAGARPHMPSIPGMDVVYPYDSTSIMELDEVPEHLVVLGGGYIALEFSQLFRRLGARVTIVQKGERLLEREDEDVSEAVRQILQEDGIRVLLGSEAVKLELLKNPYGDKVRVVTRSQGTELPIDGTHVLAALGRIPNSDGLDLEAAGVETDEHGYIKTNDKLETTAPGIYSTGDINGGPQFTHISYDDFRILHANLLDGGHRLRSDRMVPYTVFMDPQLGRVGIGEDEARAQGLEIKIARLAMNQIARPIELARDRGFAKVVIDAKTDKILGCAILGYNGGEMMCMIEIAMMGGLPYTALRDAVLAHPTLGEGLNNIFMTVK